VALPLLLAAMLVTSRRPVAATDGDAAVQTRQADTLGGLLGDRARRA